MDKTLEEQPWKRLSLMELTPDERLSWMVGFMGAEILDIPVVRLFELNLDFLKNVQLLAPEFPADELLPEFLSKTKESKGDIFFVSGMDFYPAGELEKARLALKRYFSKNIAPVIEVAGKGQGRKFTIPQEPRAWKLSVMGGSITAYSDTLYALAEEAIVWEFANLFLQCPFPVTNFTRCEDTKCRNWIYSSRQKPKRFCSHRCNIRVNSAKRRRKARKEAEEAAGKKGSRKKKS